MGVVNFFKGLFGNGNSYPSNNRVGVYGNTLNTAIQSFMGSNSNVTEKQVMQIPAAQAAIELITGAVGQLPVKLYSEDSDGMPIEVSNDYRERLLNKAPNNTLDGYSFKRKIARDYLLYGMSKTYISYLSQTSDHIKSLYPLNSKDLTIDVYTTNGVDRYGVDYLNNASGNYKYMDSLLLSILRDTNNGITGHGILEDNADIFNLALDQLKFENALMKNGATPSGIITIPNRMTDRTVKEMINAWKSSHSGSNNAGSTAVLTGGADYKAISASPDKLELNNAKKNVVSDIARVFNIPESLINAGANKYKSNEQDSIYFVQNCLDPILAAIETAFDKQLLTLKEQQNNWFFKFDTSSIVNSTLQDQANAISTLYNNGIISVKEARKDVGYRNITGSDDFLKLSQGNVLFDLQNHNLEILNKGQTATSSDVTTIPESAASQNSTESSGSNDKAKAASSNGSSDD